MRIPRVLENQFVIRCTTQQSILVLVDHSSVNPEPEGPNNNNGVRKKKKKELPLSAPEDGNKSE